MKFGFYTLGCKVNRFETQALAQLAVMRGHEIVNTDADAFIINTCTVTSVSDHKNIRAFHKIRRENPRAIIAACGCFAQTEPDKVRASGEIDLVCGTGERAAVIEQCEQAVLTGQASQCAPLPLPTAFESLQAGVPAGRTRALLKVQDGCDSFCAYCIIPYARGHIRSMPLPEVLAQVHRLCAQGVHEIVLTGIEIAAYGKEDGKADLRELVHTVCAEVPAVRIRLSSLEPRAITEDFCRTLQLHSNLMPHFHVSLQSGCDSTLARMKRRYTTAEYKCAITRLRQYFPHCSITTDVIVGFPGETQAEFACTCAFITQCAFADMHVFPYSPRKGTVAATLAGQLPPAVKAARSTQVKELARAMSHTFLDGFIGQTLTVLLEHPAANSNWSGHSPYHFSVLVDTRAGVKNHFMHVFVTHRAADGLHGRVLA